MEVTVEGLARFFEVVLPHLNEVQRRVVAGAASGMFGRGGKTAVASASGMSRNTVIKAEAEVASGIVASERLRAEGGGDKPLIDKQPGLLAALDELVHPDTRGNPMSLLGWTSKSSTHLAGELVARGMTCHRARCCACCISSATRCKPTRSSPRAVNIRIVTPSSAI